MRAVKDVIKWLHRSQLQTRHNFTTPSRFNSSSFTQATTTTPTPPMAQKATKERAKANIRALNNLHIGSFAVNFFFLLVFITFNNRSPIAWIVLSIPSFICQYVLEKTGRPVIDENTGAIKSSGEDLSAQGLTEYMWDVVWVTWGVALLVIFFGDKAWTLWAVVPAYGLYKGYGLLGFARQMAGMGSAAGGTDEAAAAPVGNRKQRRAAATSS